MDVKDLKEIIMDFVLCKLICVMIDEDNPGEIGDFVECLMGKKLEKWFEYIQENVWFVEELDV